MFNRPFSQSVSPKGHIWHGNHWNSMGGYSNLENKKCFGKGKFVSSEGNSHIWI